MSPAESTEEASNKNTTKKRKKKKSFNLFGFFFSSFATMLRRLCWPLRRRRGRCRSGSKTKLNANAPSTAPGSSVSPELRQVRVVSFNAAMFFMAPAVPPSSEVAANSQLELDIRGKTANDRPKSILRQERLSKSKRRVSINLPDNEISRSFRFHSDAKGKAPLREDSYLSPRSSTRSVMDVLNEIGADVVALQNVKAEEERGWRPLSDLAEKLGMNYVFAESWAPEYGNAILSKWPIKDWSVQKIFDDTDFRYNFCLSSS